jgi:4-carboxymuconolactone decarboxylase
VKKDQAFETGMQVRREIFGPEMAERAIENVSPFMAPFQEMLTRYCFGETWSRPGIDRRLRSIITLAMLTAQGRAEEIKIHVRGALANGVTREEMQEIFLHAMIYCGVPLSLNGFLAADEVFKAIDKD